MALVDAARAAVKELDALASSLRDVAGATAPAQAPQAISSISKTLLDALNRNQAPALVRALKRALK